MVNGDEDFHELWQDLLGKTGCTVRFDGQNDGVGARPVSFRSQEADILLGDPVLRGYKCGSLQELLDVIHAQIARLLFTPTPLLLSRRDMVGVDTELLDFLIEHNQSFREELLVLLHRLGPVKSVFLLKNVSVGSLVRLFNEQFVYKRLFLTKFKGGVADYLCYPIQNIDFWQFLESHQQIGILRRLTDPDSVDCDFDAAADFFKTLNLDPESMHSHLDEIPEECVITMFAQVSDHDFQKLFSANPHLLAYLRMVVDQIKQEGLEPLGMQTLEGKLRRFSGLHLEFEKIRSLQRAIKKEWGESSLAFSALLRIVTCPENRTYSDSMLRMVLASRTNHDVLESVLLLRNNGVKNLFGHCSE